VSSLVLEFWGFDFFCFVFLGLLRVRIDAGLMCVVFYSHMCALQLL